MVPACLIGSNRFNGNGVWTCMGVLAAASRPNSGSHGQTTFRADTQTTARHAMLQPPYQLLTSRHDAGLNAVLHVLADRADLLQLWLANSLKARTSRTACVIGQLLWPAGRL